MTTWRVCYHVLIEILSKNSLTSSHCIRQLHSIGVPSFFSKLISISLCFDKQYNPLISQTFILPKKKNDVNTVNISKSKWDRKFYDILAQKMDFKCEFLKNKPLLWIFNSFSMAKFALYLYISQGYIKHNSRFQNILWVF